MKVLGYILLVLAIWALGGLVWWGLGSFVCYAFGLHFNFTYLMGVACMFVAGTIQQITSKK